MGKMMRAIGLMSGTSMDGIDVALIETDGEDKVRRGPCATFPYSLEFRAELSAAAEAAKALRRCEEGSGVPGREQQLAELRAATAKVLRRRAERPDILRTAEQHLTDLHAEAVVKFLADNGLDAVAIDVVGFHGQTVLHEPSIVGATDSPVNVTLEPPTLTVQLGDGDALARKLGIDVVYDLRGADVASGGQGAPLTPVYHRALAARLPERPIAVVNIGGVANVTWIARDGALLAFDTGPGNALIDDWMLRNTGQAVDRDGGAAAGGRIIEETLGTLLMNDYFGRLPPKSLDRNAFPIEPVQHLSVADGAATLTAFTAATIARAREHFPEEPRLWVICGGGRRNKTLMAMIAGQVECAVAPAEAAGFNGDAVEAEAWAYMAVRSLKGLPISFPGTTGVREPMSGGVLARK